MKISAIIPCHNAELWISDTLSSVQGQLRPPDQVVIVDDASTDDSLTLIERWAADASMEVDVEQIRARNAASARNHAVARATGDWVAMLDADDQWAPDHLSRAEVLLHPTQSVAFLGFGSVISADGRPEHRSDLKPLTQTQVDLLAHDYLRLVWAKQRWRFNHCTVLYQRQRFVEVGGFDIDFPRRHDIELWLRIIAGHRWSYDAAVHAMVRQTAAGLSSKKADAAYYHLRALIKNHAALPYPETSELLRREAFRALSHALTDGSAAERKRAAKLALPLLPAWQQAALAPNLLWSAPYRLMNWARRSLRN